MYYRCIQNNLNYLNSIFTFVGIKYYIRMLREDIDGNSDLDDKDIITTSKKIDQNESIQPDKLYNYFIFKLKLNKASTSSILKK